MHGRGDCRHGKFGVMVGGTIANFFFQVWGFWWVHCVKDFLLQFWFVQKSSWSFGTFLKWVGQSNRACLLFRIIDFVLRHGCLDVENWRNADFVAIASEPVRSAHSLQGPSKHTCVAGDFSSRALKKESAEALIPVWHQPAPGARRGPQVKNQGPTISWQLAAWNGASAKNREDLAECN